MAPPPGTVSARQVPTGKPLTAATTTATAPMTSCGSTRQPAPLASTRWTTAQPLGAASGTAGANWEVVGSGDYNGDGTDDILWFNAATGTVGQYEMNDGVATWRGIGTAGANWEAVDSGDYNGDGTDDILWFNSATGTVGQYEMDDGVATWRGIGTGGRQLGSCRQRRLQWRRHR